MENFEKVFTGTGDKRVVLVNSVADPSMWVLTVYSKILFFRKKISTYWFCSKDDAEEYAAKHLQTS